MELNGLPQRAVRGARGGGRGIRDAPLSALLHPVGLGALVILVLNDHILKSAYPGWATGKLSDVAGLAFFPFFLQATYELACRAASRRPAPRHISLRAASVATGAAFAVVELTPWGDAGYRIGLGLLQWIPASLWAITVGQPMPPLQPTVATSDPSDLLALAVLPLINLPSLHRPRLRLRRSHPPNLRVERIVGAVALIASSAAIVATSPPPQPESFAKGAYVEEIELSAARPAVIREFAVRLNREAMTVDQRPSASATLTLVPSTDVAGGGGGIDLADVVLVRVIPDAADEPPSVSGGEDSEGLRFFRYDPAWGIDTCREGEPCERTYRVLLELRDTTLAPIRFDLVVEGNVRYGQDEPPAGAAIAIEAVGDPVARGPVPLAEAQAEGVVELTRFEGAEVHLRITRSAEAAAAEPQAEAVLVVESLDERPADAYPSVNVFLGHENRIGPQDGAHERYQYGDDDLPRSVFVVPFDSCQQGEACTVEYNIRFGLCCSAGEEFAGSVAWRFSVALRYLEAGELPPGADLEIEAVPDEQFQEQLVQRCIGVGREIIAKAQRSWSLSFVEAETQRAKLDRGEWLPEMVHPDWRIICDLALAGRLDPTQPVPSTPP